MRVRVFVALKIRLGRVRREGVIMDAPPTKKRCCSSGEIYAMHTRVLYAFDRLNTQEKLDFGRGRY